MNIPDFHFPNGKSSIQHDEFILDTITTVKQIYNYHPFLSESQFVPVSKACGLPRYLNMAFFRKLESIGKMEMGVTFSAFLEGWTNIGRNKFDDTSLFFNVLKKSNCQWISPEDFLPVLEDVVLNHPGLKFLEDNPLFQERYIETVICRIYYDGKCAHGRMKLSHFRKSNFSQMIQNLNPNVDLNNTRDCFSYKHFYVLYCKFWVLDEDHDLIISEPDLLNYNDGLLSQKLTKQIMLHGRISAFARDDQLQHTGLQHSVLTYLDYIWFLMSETDKSTPVAIEYWFRCMDEDGDGIITTYDLSQHWEEQDKKLQDIIESYSDECIRFDDIICQMNDLIQPEVPGQFRLRDLKRNGIIAERFFDTFLNIEKFQIHDTYQGLIRSIQQLEREKRRLYEQEKSRVLELKQSSLSLDSGTILIPVDPQEEEVEQEQEEIKYHHRPRIPFSLGAWCEYAEQEYELLIMSEQCGSVDSDWSVQNDPNDPLLIQNHLELDDHQDFFTQQQLDEDSPLQESSSSDDHESDSSAPSTPVMQDSIEDKKWLKEDEKKLNDKSSWIWHSVTDT
ncbi:hypothetical protein BD770DRAFT_429129 [Pilaira anomala]|nr:hypothetical protein BD770DRAFT_429129 [Pilaira anomala]